MVVVAVVIVVVGVVDPGMMIGGGTCRRPKCFLFQLRFSRTRSSCLLLN